MNQLHFLHPVWLLALIPLAILWWVTDRSKLTSSKAWEKVIDPKLLPLLLNGSNDKHHRSASLAKWLLALTWLIATIALADPVWEKVPRPVFQTNSARVIVLDLSNSMQIDDLKPSRLARARFKIEDILSNSLDNEASNNEEGQIGLVLFAGDAFTASPLTRDSETIRALLQVLNPDLMPSQGSRVDLGLAKAHELLTQAGVKNGQILLIADGVSDQKATLEVAKKLRNDGHQISVLGVGTEIGGTLPQLKYQNGDSITVALDTELLQEIANTGGGQYHLISTNNSDLKSVLSTAIGDTNQPKEQDDDINSEDWKSTGPFIILLILPFAALAFRRGWLFNILIATSLIGLLQPQPVLASSFEHPVVSAWNNLWVNKEQRAESALNQQQYEQAEKLSKNPLMKGTANFRQEKYKEALNNFSQAKGADARYNEGNTLAKLEKYEDAISAYDKALELDPNMEDAKQNKTTVEQFLKKKKEQEQEKQDNKNGEGKDQKDSDDKKDGEQGEDQKNKSGEKEKGDDKKDGKDGNRSDNQFSDANKDLDKNKEEKEKQDAKNAEEEKLDKEKDNAKEGDNEEKNKSDENSNQDPQEETDNKNGTKSEAEELTKEEKMAAEQWLRRIPDDPGGLLRRKFIHQYKERERQENESAQPW